MITVFPRTSTGQQLRARLKLLTRGKILPIVGGLGTQSWFPTQKKEEMRIRSHGPDSATLRSSADHERAAPRPLRATVKASARLAGLCPVKVTEADCQLAQVPSARVAPRASILGPYFALLQTRDSGHKPLGPVRSAKCGERHPLGECGMESIANGGVARHASIHHAWLPIRRACPGPCRSKTHSTVVSDLSGSGSDLQRVVKQDYSGHRVVPCSPASSLGLPPIVYNRLQATTAFIVTEGTGDRRTSSGPVSEDRQSRRALE